MKVAVTVEVTIIAEVPDNTETRGLFTNIPLDGVEVLQLGDDQPVGIVLDVAYETTDVSEIEEP